MSYILFASLIISAVSGLFSLTKQFQMLQQNSYFASRYYKWVRDSYTIGLTVTAILFCASSFLYTASLYIAQLVLICAVAAVRVALAVNAQKKSIKKLVFTSRVKRMYGFAVTFFLVMLIMYALFPGTLAGEVCTIALLMLAFVTPLLCLFCLIALMPLEKLVARWYINDAKNILKSQSNLTVIGITGSYGKTTTKVILNRILSEKFNVVATPQSFNTPMGVVRTVREKLQPQTQIFICEMGAKNIGDIKEICDIAHPSLGIITAVGEQHLDTFKTVDNVFKTKFELADEVLKNEGRVFVNGDSPALRERIKDNVYTVYGTSGNEKFRADDIEYGRNGSSFTLVLEKESIKVSTRLLGLHSVSDIVAAAAVGCSLGVSPEEIRFAVGALKPAEHRLELKSFKGGSLLIDDAYNANPVGCLEAVRVLSRFDGMKKVIVTPGLVELGEKEYESNYALGLEAARYCDIIILVGLNRSKPMREAAESVGFDKNNLHIAASFAEAMEIYEPLADSKTVVLFENDLPDNYLN